MTTQAMMNTHHRRAARPPSRSSAPFMTGPPAA
jgi:hypothetical protein